MTYLDPYDPNTPQNATFAAELEIENPSKRSEPISLRDSVVTFIFAMAIFLVYFGISRFFSIPAVRHQLSAFWARGLLSAGVVAAGFGAYRFKRANQAWYGRVEIAFGIASCLKVTMTNPMNHSLLVEWAALFGCAYVVARGFGNVWDGRAKSRNVPANSP